MYRLPNLNESHSLAPSATDSTESKDRPSAASSSEQKQTSHSGPPVAPSNARVPSLDSFTFSPPTGAASAAARKFFSSVPLPVWDVDDGHHADPQPDPPANPRHDTAGVAPRSTPARGGVRLTSRKRRKASELTTVEIFHPRSSTWAGMGARGTPGTDDTVDESRAEPEDSHQQQRE